MNESSLVFPDMVSCDAWAVLQTVLGAARRPGGYLQLVTVKYLQVCDKGFRARTVHGNPYPSLAKENYESEEAVR